MVQNYNQTFESVDYTDHNNDNGCKFFYEKTEYEQKCPRCRSSFFINSKKHRNIINSVNIKKNCVYEFDSNSNTYYKNYRTTQCLSCDSEYEISFTTKYYCFFGLICWKILHLYIPEKNLPMI